MSNTIERYLQRNVCLFFERLTALFKHFFCFRNMDERANIMDVFLRQMEETEVLLERKLNVEEEYLLQEQQKTDNAYLKLFPV